MRVLMGTSPPAHRPLGCYPSTPKTIAAALVLSEIRLTGEKHQSNRPDEQPLPGPCSSDAHVNQILPHQSLDHSERYGFLAILAVHLLLRVGFYQGILPSDPIFYVHYAQKLATGEFQLEYHHFNTRFAVTLPVAFFFRMFGTNEFAVALWPLICSIVSLYLTFRLGELFGGAKAGLLASGLLAVLPLDIGLSMQLMPEPVLTAMLTACVWCFYNGYHSQNVASSRAWLLAAGVALWFAYSAKILGVLLGPILVSYALHQGLRFDKLIWFALGFLALLIPEYSFYFFKSGDLMFPFHAISAVHEKAPSVIAANQNLYYRLFKAFPSMTIYPSVQFGITFLFIYLAAAYCCLYWRKYILLLLWFAGLFGYNNFGSSNLSHYVVLGPEVRYLHPVVIPGLILLGLTISELFWRKTPSAGNSARRSLITILASGVIISLVIISLLFSAFGLRRSYLELSAIELGKLNQFLQSNAHSTVYADDKDLSWLRFLMQDHAFERLKLFPEPAASDSMCDYIHRFPANAQLLYNWRVISTDTWLFPPRQRTMLVELHEAGALKPTWAYWDRPGAWFYKLAKIDLFYRTLGKQERIEFFDGNESARGISFFIDSSFCEADLRTGTG